MKKFSIFLADGRVLVIRAVRYRREGNQYVFEKDKAAEDVSFFKVDFVEGIYEGEFKFGRKRRS